MIFQKKLLKGCHLKSDKRDSKCKRREIKVSMKVNYLSLKLEEDQKVDLKIFSRLYIIKHRFGRKIEQINNLKVRREWRIYLESKLVKNQNRLVKYRCIRQ